MSEKYYTLYVEGIADVVFFKQYIQHCFGISIALELQSPMNALSI